MPSSRRRQRTAEEKYRDAKCKIDEILQQYSLEEINRKHSEYNRLRRQPIIDDSLQISNNFELSVGPQRCENCQRYIVGLL